jgi:hypothetical protein
MMYNGLDEAPMKEQPYDFENPKRLEAMDFARRSFRKYADTYRMLAKSELKDSQDELRT